MSDELDKKKTVLPLNLVDEDESESGGSGEQGQGGKIVFKDFLAPLPSREDLLPDEKRRLLSQHDHLVEANVKKQKDKRSHYKALKEKKISLSAHREGLANGMQSQYRNHPVLSDKAQFSGIDRQVNPVSNENIADTNEANRNELENQYRLRHAPGMQPKFNPKPQFR